jgi:serine-type D-Ala-D-Ala carboxypeptidase/endopeptidase (penicillin-binding protein 4)
MRWLISVAMACFVVTIVASTTDPEAAVLATPRGDRPSLIPKVRAQHESEPPPRWHRKIDQVIGGRAVGVAVRIDGDNLFERAARVRRVPASNEKLLLSFPLFDDVGPNKRFVTKVSAPAVGNGVIDGNLYVLGAGDPTIMSSAKHARPFGFRCTRLGRLARKIRKAGVTRITGRVTGAVHYFARDWFAPGWKATFPADEVALPSALTFNTNSVSGNHIADPELRVARSLTAKLEKLGVSVAGAPRAGTPPGGLIEVARIRSERLKVLVRYMNRQSSNFFAEVLGKGLGVERYGRPGTIAKGARGIRSWADANGVSLKAFDGSGLSYRNRVSPRGMARLLDSADEEAWGPTLRAGLPTGNQGTLEDRLAGVPVRAKTGTLSGVSALSGWVYLKRRSQWAPFSILSQGMPKSTAANIEDRIVRILVRSAR